MARSYRTRPSRIIARDRIARDRSGAVRYPRIVVHPPAPGDVHPLPKALLRELLPQLLPAYLYGLKRIELRPRLGADIGRPFGIYWGSNRTIWLNSLPLHWFLPDMTPAFRQTIQGFDALVTDTPTGAQVVWHPIDLAAYLFFDVFLHELGHHYAVQYRTKKRFPAHLSGQEQSAEDHKCRLISAYIARFPREQSPFAKHDEAC
jgi:hypothetical protein